MKTCSIPSCGNKYEAKGFCGKHYMRFRRHGDPLRNDKEIHGMTNTKIFKVWGDMIDRCRNKKHHAYQYYGGRGIAICVRWENSFIAFYEDMGPKPFPEAQIDRIDNDGNYEPGNCRWTTSAENARNRSSIKLSFAKAEEIRSAYKGRGNGISQFKLADLYGVSRSTIESIVLNKTWKP